MLQINGLLPKSPGANIKEFLLTILSEANFDDLVKSQNSMAK